MRRRNFTGLAALGHLNMSECGIGDIERGAFADLVALRWLDLSNNRIPAVHPATFSGARLQHLFLNGNRHIRLDACLFDGLETTGLYLHDCSVVDVRAGFWRR